jgi:hypothetical protein
MHSAIGYCSSVFSPSDPGRLCRGRERWIQAAQEEDVDNIHRLVVSGACFTDDSARDAQRGLRFSGMDIATLVMGLFPGKNIVAWAEDAHPRQVPDQARGLEAYDQAMPRGPLRRWAVRWSMQGLDEESLREATSSGADVLLVFDDAVNEVSDSAVQTSFLPPLADGDLDAQNQGGLPEELRSLLFLLTGYRCDGPPFRCFQPTVIPEILAQTNCRAVILVHQDKHAPCIGVYLAGDGVKELEDLYSLGTHRECLVVPFAIPPMLARWDRALWELRQTWNSDDQGEFPVTVSTDGRSWGRRMQNESTPVVENTEDTAPEETEDTVVEEDEAELIEDGEELIDDDEETEDDSDPEESPETFVEDDFGDVDDAFEDIAPVEESSESDDDESGDTDDDESDDESSKD